jgi:hypothetical protein
LLASSNPRSKQPSCRLSKTPPSPSHRSRRSSRTPITELLLDFERVLEPRLAAGTGDLAHLIAGWAAKLTGATCRIAALLHLAAHLRDGWARPVAAETLAGAIRLAGYLTDHALTVFDLMGADPRIDDARWLLDWINRTGHQQFTRRAAHHAAPRGRFRKATDFDPPLALLEEHGYLRRADPEPSRDPHGRGRPPSPRFLVNPLIPSTESTETTKTLAGRVSVVLWILSTTPERTPMASAGIRKTPPGRHKVWWRLDDGSQGSQTFPTRDRARDFKHDLLAQVVRGSWVDPRLGKQTFAVCAWEWWEVWSADPDRSPATLQATEGRLRRYLVPSFFGQRQLRAITVSMVRRWQNELRGNVGYDTVMACRSLLNRILQAA